MAEILNQNSLEALLLSLTNPKEAARSSQILALTLERFESCEFFTLLLKQSKDANVRNLSAVYLRKQLSKFQKQFQRADLTILREVLLQRIDSEVQKQACFAVGSCLVEVVRLFGWDNSLLPSLHFIVNDDSTPLLQKQVCFTIARNLVEPLQSEPLDLFLHIFISGLKLPDDKCVLESMRGFSETASVLRLANDTSKVETFRSNFKHLLTACIACMQRGTSDVLLQKSIIIWHELALKDMLSVPDKPSIEYHLTIAESTNLDFELRKEAVFFFQWFLTRFPSFFSSEGFVPRLLQVIVMFVDLDLNVAEELYSTLLCTIKASKLREAIIQAVEKLAGLNQLRLSIFLLSSLGPELERYSDLFPNIMKFIEAGLQNESADTRKLTYRLVKSYSLDAKDFIGAKQFPDLWSRLKERLFSELKQNRNENARELLDAMRRYCRARPSELIQTADEAGHLPDLMRLIVDLLGDESHKMLWIPCFNCVDGFVATCSENQAQLPMMESFLKIILQKFASNTEVLDEQNVSLHSTIVSVLGTLIYYKEPKVLQHMNEISSFVLQTASNSTSEELHTACCMLFCDLAQVLGEDLGKSDGFNQIVELCWNILKSDNGIKNLEDSGFGTGTANEASIIEMDLGSLDEKCTAVKALTHFAKFCREGYFPFAKQSVDLTLKIWNIAPSYMKKHLINSLYNHLVICLGDSRSDAEQMELILTTLLTEFAVSEHEELICILILVFTQLFENFFDMMRPVVPIVLNSIGSILNGTAPCRKPQDVEVDDETAIIVSLTLLISILRDHLPVHDVLQFFEATLRAIQHQKIQFEHRMQVIRIFLEKLACVPEICSTFPQLRAISFPTADPIFRNISAQLLFIGDALPRNHQMGEEMVQLFLQFCNASHELLNNHDISTQCEHEISERKALLTWALSRLVLNSSRNTAVVHLFLSSFFIHESNVVTSKMVEDILTALQHAISAAKQMNIEIDTQMQQKLNWIQSQMNASQTEV